MKLFLTKSGKFDAIADYNEHTKEFVVLKGSCVSDTISTAPTFRGAKTIEKQRKLYVEKNIVQENVVFKSSSTAGNFVTGNSTNGPSSWKDENGKKLKVILAETKE